MYKRIHNLTLLQILDKCLVTLTSKIYKDVTWSTHMERVAKNYRFQTVHWPVTQYQPITSWHQLLHQTDWLRTKIHLVWGLKIFLLACQFIFLCSKCIWFSTRLKCFFGDKDDRKPLAFWSIDPLIKIDFSHFYDLLMTFRDLGTRMFVGLWYCLKWNSEST